MKTNQKLCAICDKKIILLGFENRIIKNHNDRINEFRIPSYDAMINIKEFEVDPHIKCRINCSRYFVAGLASRWFTTSQFEITAGNKTAYQTIEELKKMSYFQLQSNGVYLFGTPGVGKTHLLAELCKSISARVANPRNIFWGNTSSILTNLRASFGKKNEPGEETFQEKILNRLKARYLFLDDLGTETPSDWAKETLYEAINYRYEEHLPLFVSSNSSPQSLSEKLGDKFVSRLVEMCKPIALKGDDIRLKKRESNKSTLNTVIPEYSYQMASWDLKSLQE